MTVAAAGGPQNRSVGSRAARDIVQSRGVRTAARTRERRRDLALPLVGRARAPSRNNCTQKRTRSSSSFARSEEHTSELQSLMRNPYAVFGLKKKQKTTTAVQSLQLKDQYLELHPLILQYYSI